MHWFFLVSPTGEEFHCAPGKEPFLPGANQLCLERGHSWWMLQRGLRYSSFTPTQRFASSDSLQKVEKEPDERTARQQVNNIHCDDTESAQERAIYIIPQTENGVRIFRNNWKFFFRSFVKKSNFLRTFAKKNGNFQLLRNYSYSSNSETQLIIHTHKRKAERRVWQRLGEAPVGLIKLDLPGREMNGNSVWSFPSEKPHDYIGHATAQVCAESA